MSTWYDVQITTV